MYPFKNFTNMEITINSIFDLEDKFYFISNNKITFYWIKQIQYSGIENVEDSSNYIKYALCRAGSTSCEWTPTEKELLKAVYEDFRFFKTKKDAVKYIMDQM